MSQEPKPLKRKRVVVVMYDTLCRHFLPTYGNEWIIAPNFKRLASRSVQFQNFYVGSMPCMPARREMHTGRYNFLHRAWGPLEPFDDSMPQALHASGVHSHKVTDHHHYWEDGGATYHQRYTTFDLVRGQEGDKWIGDVDKLKNPEYGKGGWPENEALPMRRQDKINREHIKSSQEMPQHKTFSLGLDFIERNHDAKNDWYLQIETFDPHEPFFTQQEFQDLYPHEYDGPPFDWPPYREIREDDQTIEHIRYMYAALVTFCDQQLGRVLDAFDKYNLWEDTMLVVNTDHGFLMGEHDWWAKVVTPFFQEIAHIPFWCYDPRYPDCVDVRRDALAQTIDLGPTVLDFFGIPQSPDATGSPLLERMLSPNARARDASLYGVFGGQVNVTDGRYVYMRGPATRDNQPLYEYTLMPTRMRGMFKPKELQNWTRDDGFDFTKDVKIMKIPSRTSKFFTSETTPMGRGRMATLLFDVVNDPGQTMPLSDENVEAEMIRLMLHEMIKHDCPMEQYVRLGLPRATDTQFPTELEIQQACACKSQRGQKYQEWGGNGYPKLAFGPVVWEGEPTQQPHFPDNLRLRPGYKFSQTKTAPVEKKKKKNNNNNNSKL